MYDKGSSGAEVGDTVAITMNQIHKRITDLEQWKNNDLEPWRNTVNVELETVKSDTRDVSSKLEQVTEQIKKIQSTSMWNYIRDIMIISLVILMFIFIIIFSL